MEIDYILQHLGEERANYYGAVVPPVFQTSNFSFKSVNEFRNLLLDESKGPLYTRGKNPTVAILCKKIAALDGAESSLVFSSGIAAIVTPLIHLLKQGDHIVSVRNVYSWTTRLFTELLPKFGITHTFVDGTNPENFFSAVQPNTRLIYLESPNTFTFEIQDLNSIAAFAKKNNILTMIDNSYSSPLLQQPIAMGIDLSAQSASKYFGGHSDIVAGVLSGSRSILDEMYKRTYLNIGAIISPFNAFLMLRGIRTLELRLNRIADSTEKVVSYLAVHPKVEKVIWPFHASHPQSELAKKQMKKGGGLFAFTLKTNELSKIESFCNNLQSFLMAVSWGGHESLIIPVCATIKQSEFDPTNEKHRYIRMYIGLEDPEYLIKDLNQALNFC